ncbi:MAG: 4-alpha-glucanotransferase [Spirochaetes bacterium]|nr:4-alpha-glucanotransferase [Spirochaetota bacterium]
MKQRISGIIVHPTSFPGKYGCGDLGAGAYFVIDWLQEAGQKVLQTLSIGPTGFGDSPYASFSAFAGNPYFISFDKLISKGWLKEADLKDYPKYSPVKIDYSTLFFHKFRILRKAFSRFQQTSLPQDFLSFCQEHSDWLEDYALFMALKDSYDGRPWDQWLPAHQNKNKLGSLSSEIKEDAQFYRFCQWEFYNQWHEFKEYANHQGIKLIGDVPFYVQYDSSDVWGHTDLFYLDENLKPEVVAGVPPDFFSKTGQLWGNPCYNWKEMENRNFSWWRKRISHLHQFVDSVRVDHFRGFEAYWSIPFGEETAINGQWIKTPGEALFCSFQKEFGDDLSEIMIAEDLGVITDEVHLLRNNFKIAGMKIFQMANFYALKDPSLTAKETPDSFFKTEYLPENYETNCIAYPGTHDNDVLKGWFPNQDDDLQKIILEYLGIEGVGDLNYAVIEKLMAAQANGVIFQLQDVLELDSESRMNLPGTCGAHNWSWRLTEEQLSVKVAERLNKLTKKYQR